MDILVFALSVILMSAADVTSSQYYDSPTSREVIHGTRRQGADNGYQSHTNLIQGFSHGPYQGPTAIPTVLDNGHIADTYEVAAAKAEHLAALTKAKALWRDYKIQSGKLNHDPYQGLNDNPEDAWSEIHMEAAMKKSKPDTYNNNPHHGNNHVSHRFFQGSNAALEVLQNGHIPDTHEVATAKARHLSAVAKIRSREGLKNHQHKQADSKSYIGDVSYQGPTANTEELPSGFMSDSFEVVAAKSAFLGTFSQQSNGYSHGHHGDLRYHGPTAIPHVLYDGHIADTHEVAAAKAEHLAAVAKASAHGGHSGHYSHGSHSGVAYHGHHGDLRYHGPTVIPHVLHDGHTADTHEVAAAKAEHLAAVAKASAHGGHSGHYSHGSHSGVAYHGHHGDLRYHGPTAIPHVLHDGHIADTHEVAAAKAEHLAAVAKAIERLKQNSHNSGSSSSDVIPGHPNSVSSYTPAFLTLKPVGSESSEGYHSKRHDHGSYSSNTNQGPFANVVVLPSGYLADTEEVAAAKRLHLHAHHLQLSYKH